MVISWGTGSANLPPPQSLNDLWDDLRKLETFQSHVDQTDPRTPEAASAAPIRKLENREILLGCRCYAFVCKCGVVGGDSGISGSGNGGDTIAGGGACELCAPDADDCCMHFGCRFKTCSIRLSKSSMKFRGTSGAINCQYPSSTRFLRGQGLLCKPCLYLIPASRTFSHCCSSLILMHSIIYDNASKTLSTLLGIRIYFPLKNIIQSMPLLKLTSASRSISAPMANFPSSHRPHFQTFSAPLDR